jgi:hypothetical protein
LVLNVLLEYAPLTLDGAFVLLMTGRDSSIECYWHPGPPGVPEYLERLEQALRLKRIGHSLLLANVKGFHRSPPSHHSA